MSSGASASRRRATPALDVAACLEDDGREILVLLLAAEDVQALHERQAGVDHHGELPREDGQALGRRLLAEFAGGLDRASARAFAAAIFVTSTCSRLRAATAASIESATRSPATFWPARVLPEYANVVAMAYPYVRLPTVGRARPGAVFPCRPRDHADTAVDHFLQFVLVRRVPSATSSVISFFM
jgi:hypothetical protein